MTRLSRRSLGLSALGVAGTVLVGCSNDAAAPIPTASVPSLVGSTPAGTASGSAVPSGSGAPSASPSATSTRPPAKLITNLDGITVKGPQGAAPYISAPYPFKVDKTLSKVVIAGKGPVVPKDATVFVDYEGFNAGVGGKAFDSSFSTGKPATFQLSQVVPGFGNALIGKRIGDRVLMVISSKDGYTEGRPEAGIAAGDCLLFVVDILFATLSEPWGTPVTPSVAPSNLANLASLPTVKDNGPKKAPTVTIPSGATKPTGLVVQTLIEGNGPAVEAASQIQAHYVSVDWDTQKVIADDYPFAPETAKIADLVTAWKTGLVGKKGGSRVLIIAPPDTTYPNGNATPSVSATSTQVYVVDILFTGAALS